MKSTAQVEASAKTKKLVRPCRSGGEPRDGMEHRPTARESELIALIALGHSNKVIAYELGISPNTVRAHIGNIMRKYNLKNRTQIAILLTPMIKPDPVLTVRHR
jgi:DNA-binding NarL/FixJ family response regulator